MIEVFGIHHRYPDGTVALNGIDLTVSDGEFLLICGPNGSGKTTLTRILTGLLKPTSGVVRVNGLEASQYSKEVRRMVGMVFQEADSQIVGETVREDVSFGPENLGLPASEIAARATEVLQAMGLEEVAEKPCYLLSGGEKRRVAIAGVLAMKPHTLLFDEPFSHLDYPGVREVLGIMIRLHHEGHTLVVTTHDVEKVIAHVTRVAVIQKGRLEASGSPDDLVAKLREFGVRPPCYALLGKDRISWLND
jgi:cobalt transport protein ATP-binding subunit